MMEHHYSLEVRHCILDIKIQRLEMAICDYATLFNRTQYIK